MHTLFVFLTGLCLLLTAGAARNRTSTSFVSDCIALQEALTTDRINKVVVTGTVRCTRSSWQVPVVVSRNVEITGDPSETNSTDTDKRASIDWTDLSHVVLVERAAVSVHDLVMFQDELGVGGLTVKFIHTREGATAVFAGVVVIVGSCSQPVVAYHALIAEIPRPGFFAGDQKTETIGSNVLLVQDVAIWWPNLNSVWQLCNGIIVCLDNYDGEVNVDQYFNSGLVTNSCAVIVEAMPNALEALTQTPDQTEIEATGEEDNGGSDDTTRSLVIVAIAIAMVVFVTAAVSYKCFWGHRRTPSHAMSFNSRKDHSSMEDTSAKDGTSSRFLGNKNENFELLERGNVPLQDVVIGTLLGRGGFGRVFKGTWKGTSVAIKVIAHGERQLHNELRLPFEAYLSRHINHPNVVQTFLIHTRQKDSANGITMDTLDYNVESPSVKKGMSGTTHDVFSNLAEQNVAMGHDGGDLFETWLVLEFCDRGSLWKTIKKGYFTQNQTVAPLLDHVLLSALDVANAMNYLHSLGITHGDLKADNVLLKSANTDRRGFFCKVSDFGLSRYVGSDDYLQTFTYGTLSHMPPELLKNGVFSTAVDVYSFGILLWELLAVTRPYDGRSHGDILMMVVNEGRRPQITDYYPEMYADLIKDCWKQNPDDRPKFGDIVRRLKKMLTDLELEKDLLRDVNDSAGSRENKGERRRDIQRPNYLDTPPDEPASGVHQEGRGEPDCWMRSRQSTDSAGSMSASSQTSSSDLF